MLVVIVVKVVVVRGCGIVTRLEDLWGTAEVKWSRLKVMWLGGVVCGQEEDIRHIITHSNFPSQCFS